MSSPGSPHGGHHEWPSAPTPHVRDFEARLSQREALLREGLADLEIQLAELQASVASGCAGAAERATLADAFEALRRELACIVSARRAMASLRQDLTRESLVARRGDPALDAAGGPPRRPPRGSVP